MKPVESVPERIIEREGHIEKGVEFDKYGIPTGKNYLKCLICGDECLEKHGGPDHLSGCPEAKQ
ncbi:hypothetical protein [Halocatena halophila]|uniref:hypothetical protein n=1 Tax=Halocatena halophila TaxID=2814576 RepID=UPI002ED24F92